MEIEYTELAINKFLDTEVRLQTDEMRKKFYNLLNVKEPPKYKLRVNSKYSAAMDRDFWRMIIYCYNEVDFQPLEDDILFELREIK